MAAPIHIVHQALTRGGGMERYALALARSLVDLGHEVVFHARKADKGLAGAVGVELDLMPIARFPRKLQDWRFFRRVARWRNQAEGTQIALSRVQVRDLVVCGGTHRGYLEQSRKVPGPFDWLQIWMETQAYRCARIVLAHSDLCREELIRLYRVPEQNIVTLYPPADSRFPRSSPSRKECRRRLELPPDKIIFLFPSLGHGRKGLHPVCDALAGLDEPFLIAVAGKDADSGRHAFLLPLGYVEDMPLAYRAADFTLLGSAYEPFGLVGPESVLCGTRLVFEERIGCLPAIQPEVVITFSVRDPASVRGAVAKAIALARQNQHGITAPRAALRYDPSPAKHAEALLRCLQARP